MPPRYDPILLPAIVLVLWTLTMLVWLSIARGRAVKAARIDIMARRGGRGQDLEKATPAESNWPAHNYTHLLEQPTLFYAAALVTAMIGAGGGWGVTLAWIYVASRIAHSIWQSTVNLISVRFALFAIGTTALLALAVRALLLLVNAR